MDSAYGSASIFTNSTDDYTSSIRPGSGKISNIYFYNFIFGKIIFIKILFLAMTRQTTPKKERRPHTAIARISSARKERVRQVYDHIMLRLLFLTPTLSEFEILNDSTSIIQKWLDFVFSKLEFRWRTLTFFNISRKFVITIFVKIILIMNLIIIWNWLKIETISASK